MLLTHMVVLQAYLPNRTIALFLTCNVRLKECASNRI